MTQATPYDPDGERPAGSNLRDPLTEADFEKLNADILATLSTGIGPTTAAHAPTDVLHELAEDMTHVLSRLQAVEAVLARLGVRIDQVDARVGEAAQSIGSELATQRRDLLGERKGLLARGLFNAVIGQLDALRAMRLALHDSRGRVDKPNQRIVSQLEAVETTLLTGLQGMGFREFHARVGEVFSPSTMECLGYAPGAVGVVLKALRTGFASAEGVARPAGVVIAEPQAVHPRPEPR